MVWYEVPQIKITLNYRSYQEYSMPLKSVKLGCCLEQCFLGFNVDMNHVQILIKRRFLFTRSGVVPEVSCICNMLSSDTDGVLLNEYQVE